MNTISRISLIILLILPAAFSTAYASWIETGTPVCTYSQDQLYQVSLPDGEGGAFFAWEDERNGGDPAIYVQRIDRTGSSLWSTNGIMIGALYAEDPVMVLDGTGGVIVAWTSKAGASFEVFAQRIDCDGVIQWTAGGVKACWEVYSQHYPAITADGSGGAILAWTEYRYDNNNIIAQRIDDSGAILWGSTGVEVVTDGSNQNGAKVVGIGLGESIVVWHDNRGADIDIYAQKLNSAGSPKWVADGVSVCSFTGDQYPADAMEDGAGGAIILWEDDRAGNDDIYVQKIDNSGTKQWASDGRAVCTQVDTQEEPRMVTDGDGGAIIAWNDFRVGSDNVDIYAQKVNSTGNTSWILDGVAICEATWVQGSVDIATDGNGGAVMVWIDYRTIGSLDIYAQKVDDSGSTQWTADGVAVCIFTSYKNFPTVVTGEDGGAIFSWVDDRAGSSDRNIYAHSLTSEGVWGLAAPVIDDVRDVPGDQGGLVNVAWRASDRDVVGSITEYTVWRAISISSMLMAEEKGALLMVDLSQPIPDVDVPVIRMESAGDAFYYWYLIDTRTAYHIPGYSVPAATMFDSTAASDEYHYFQIIAHTSDPLVFYVSDPDSGYSIDNLAPVVPLGFIGEQSYTPEGIHLSWEANEEFDLSGYRIYRGLTEVFEPGPENLLTSIPDTTTLDDTWTWDSGYYYKLAAVDIHGNESAYALLAPAEITGDDDPAPSIKSYLSQNYPNPFNPNTSISFSIGSESAVSLRIYDVSGRLVRTLVSRRLGAGGYNEIWDGIDEQGTRVSSGIYFYRLVAGDFEQTRKMVLLR